MRNTNKDRRFSAGWSITSTRPGSTSQYTGHSALDTRITRGQFGKAVGLAAGGVAAAGLGLGGVANSSNTDSSKEYFCPSIISHRSSGGLYPDNTLEGIEYCIRNGARHIEIDVCKTSDNQLVLSHSALNLNSTDVKNMDYPGRPDQIGPLKELLSGIPQNDPRYAWAQKLLDFIAYIENYMMYPYYPKTRTTWHAGNLTLAQIQALTVDFELDPLEFGYFGEMKPVDPYDPSSEKIRISYHYPFRATHDVTGNYKIPTLEEALALVNSLATEIGVKISVNLDLKAQPYCYDTYAEFSSNRKVFIERLMDAINGLNLRGNVKISYISDTHQLLKDLHDNYGIARKSLGLYLFPFSMMFPAELLGGCGVEVILRHDAIRLPEPGTGTILDILQVHPDLKNYIGKIFGSNELTRRDVAYIKTYYKMDVVFLGDETGLNAARDELCPDHPDFDAAYEKLKVDLQSAMNKKVKYLNTDHTEVTFQALEEIAPGCHPDKDM